MKKRCLECGTIPSAVAMVCRGCYGAMYCSIQCQSQHRMVHSISSPGCRTSSSSIDTQFIIRGDDETRRLVIQLFNQFTKESLQHGVDVLLSTEHRSEKAPRVRVHLGDEAPYCLKKDRACTDGTWYVP